MGLAQGTHLKDGAKGVEEGDDFGCIICPYCGLHIGTHRDYELTAGIGQCVRCCGIFDLSAEMADELNGRYGEGGFFGAVFG